MTLQIQTPPTLNDKWLTTTLTKDISKNIREFFEDHEYHNHLENIWYEMIEETNPQLHQKFIDLNDNPPCLGSDLWWYEEKLGKPPGFEIFIHSMIRSMEFDKDHPNWNDPKKKHLGLYWTNPYEINYHEKTTYTADELKEHYKNYDKNQQDILDQINALPITQELQASIKQTLINTDLWEKSIESKEDIETYNQIIKAFNQELWKNITLDTINQPRNVHSPLPEYDENFYMISIP